MSFFPMARGDRLYLLLTLASAGLAFLPWTRDLTIAGMALLGWWMAALMVVAPLVALLRVLRDAGPARGTRD